jgi:hypothetical protein
LRHHRVGASTGIGGFQVNKAKAEKLVAVFISLEEAEAFKKS